MIKNLKLSELELNSGQLEGLPKNPRLIRDERFEKLKKSIEEAPEMLALRELLVYPLDSGKFIVIGGNMRLRACKDLGYKELPCKIIAKETPIEKLREYTIKDNVAFGQEDWDMLANDWDAEKLDDWGLDVWQDETQEHSAIDEDEAPEVDTKSDPKTKIGDIWQLGRHRLMCGDSTKEEDVAKLMNGNKADMVFTDPPYLMGFTGNVHADGSKSFNSKHGAIKNDKMSREDGDNFILDIFENIKKFCVGSFYVCFYRLGLDYIFRALDILNNKYKALIIWDKGNHTLSNSDYMSRYEPIVYGWFNEHKFYGDRSNFDIWNVQRTQKNDLHPTMKPIALCKKAINNSSKQDDGVLDLFGGSGSTLIACEQLNRICYMMELDPRYCDVILKRWEDVTGEKATLVGKP